MENPSRIVCLTEESVETLYLLGEERRIVGVSAFVKRPPETKNLKRVSAFTSANIPKILELGPDLVLGFSDIQKDIARDLIGAGVNVFIANHRSLDEILNYILLLGRMVDQGEKAIALVDSFKEKLKASRQWAQSLKIKPRIHLEEWDEPLISGIQWFAELVEACGGELCFPEKAKASLAMDRTLSHDQVIAANPDIIFGCWCGKPVDISSIEKREGYAALKAVKNQEIYELEPEIFLQPGPAPFVDGLDIMRQHIENWVAKNS
jgi:iron complex transport system substrate-binding protein